MKVKFKNWIHIASPFLVYMIIYMTSFYLIRFIQVDRYYHPCISLDLKIPFIPIFVVPYLSWLGWIPFIWLYTLFHDESLFKKISYMMMISMTLYLLFSVICPTELALRPTLLNCKDLWCKLSAFLYTLTPETYVFPSLHVFHSLVALYAIFHGRGSLFLKRDFRLFGLIWTILICLSTVFVRQHSVIDVGGGALLFLIMMKCFNLYENKKGDVLRK